MNNPKVEFLRKFNDAFIKPDIPFIVESLTDDVEWTMMGDRTFNGKAEVKAFFDQMDGCQELLESNIHSIITHGKSAAVNGDMKMKENGETRSYGFCDVYEFNGFKNPRIKKLTSYMVALK